MALDPYILNLKKSGQSVSQNCGDLGEVDVGMGVILTGDMPKGNV